MPAEIKTDNFCIVLSGFPASGKSSLGQRVADHLDLDLLDKDVFLEQLFDRHGAGDADWRQSLSRQSNQLFQQAASEKSRVVLVSHWRPRTPGFDSGTPSEWLSTHFQHIVELSCECPLEVAVSRFIERQRHPGHLDSTRSPEQIVQWFQDYQRYLPLGLGALVSTSTHRPERFDRLIQRLITRINRDSRDRSE